MLALVRKCDCQGPLVAGVDLVSAIQDAANDFVLGVNRLGC
jgi:hypothetical protein